MPTERQIAMDKAIQTFLGGLGQFANIQQKKEAQERQDVKTQRQQALQGLQLQQQLGASPEQISQFQEGGDISGLQSAVEQQQLDKETTLFNKQQRETEDRLVKEQERIFSRGIKTRSLDIRETEAQARKLEREQARIDKKQAAAITKQKRLSPVDIRKFNEGKVVPTQLLDIQDTIANNADIFGPVEGRFRSMNPYDTRAQTIEAQVRASSQSFGRYMEGGVLRKEDEEKYRKMFPNLSDTPDVATNKLAVVQRLLAARQKSDINALRDQGFDVTGLEFGGEVPAVPAIIAGGAPEGGQPAVNIATAAQDMISPGVQAAPVPTPAPVEVERNRTHPQANAMLDYARQNPNDPRSAAILQRLGVQ